MGVHIKKHMKNNLQSLLFAAATTIAISANAQTTIYVQPAGATTSNFWPTDPGSLRWQQDYSSSFFGSSPISISSFSFVNYGDVTGPISYPSFSITFSTTSVTPGSLSTTYSANVGADATTVFSGPITLTDIGGLTTFNLTTPFTYDPSQGNLLIDIDHGASSSGDPMSFISYDTEPTGLLQRVADGPDTAIGNDFGFGTLQTEFAASPTPEPCTLALAGFGSLSLLAFRRRK